MNVVLGISGETEILGVTRVRLELIGYSCWIEVLVTKSSPEPCIIGSDLLSQHPALAPVYWKLKEVCHEERETLKTASRTKLVFKKSRSYAENLSQTTSSWQPRNTQAQQHSVQINLHAFGDIKEQNFASLYKICLQMVS